MFPLVILSYVMHCAIWHHLENVKSTHRGVFDGYFSRFLNCSNSTKSPNGPHISSCFSYFSLEVPVIIV